MSIKFRVWNHEDGAFNFSFVGKDSDSVMQFTGFEDKSGKEIYEGDVVHARDLDGKPCVAKVVFHQGAFCLERDNEPWDGLYLEPLEIIGNVYENPELLQEAKKAA